MARVAGWRELSGYVVRILGLLKVPRVAGEASCWQTLKLPDCRALVTIVTLHGRVSSEQRETILVIFYRLYGNIPALHSVALRAVGAHSPLVNVGVAVLTIPGDIAKDWLGVTLYALHFFVHAAKRILGIVVIKLRHGPDRTPTLSGVTVFAWNRERPVRTLASLPLRGERSRRSGA